MTQSGLRRACAGVLVGVLAAAGQLASAQTAPAGRETSAASVGSYRLTDQMPVDPEAVVGTLPNGLRYYVRANGKPDGQAELRLVVKAGSVLEDDDQLGLAHFVEHMEFEGTRHFPQQSIGDFLGSLGLSIGPDANAVTSFDDTQYTLRVPTGLPGALDRALLVLEDWAQGASFDQRGIDRERGIVLSEWRMHLGADERTQDQIRRVQLEGSRYADRPPIGSPDVVERAQRAQLTRFYRDWYRPNLMAVIVVGDIDRDAVTAMIKQHFSSLTNPVPERPRPAYDVPERAATRYAVVTDKEKTGTTVEVSDLRPARNQGSVGGYRDIILDQLFAVMLNDRLAELSQSATPPFFAAQAGRALFGYPRTRDEAALQGLVSNDGVTRGLDGLVTALQRVVQFGFTATELARAKQAMMLSYERSVTESPDRESESRADEYTRNFLGGEALPTIWQELAFHRRFVPAITLADVNALAADWFPDGNRLVVVSAPKSESVVLPDQSQLAAAVSTALAKRLEPYVDADTGRGLMDAPPSARGTVVRTTTRAAAGITEWTLSNGATVVLKPTTLKEDQILFRAVAAGGTSLSSDSDFRSASVADEVISAGGLGQFNAVTLDKILAGKAVDVRPFINEIDQGLAGGSTPQDIESMFQLIYLRFTQPRADPTTFTAMKSQMLGLLENRSSSPDVVFDEAIDATLSQNSPRRSPDTPATVQQWSLDKSLAFYKARFADASGFTFVFVGSFTPETIRPLVERYIASLPATRARETWRNLGIEPPRGVVEKTIQKGIAPKSEVAIVFSGPLAYDDTTTLALRAMVLVLESRLSDAIREQLGGTYSITATANTQKIPRPEYRVRIAWTCDPARTASLVKRVFEEIAFVKSTLLTMQQVFRLQDVMRRDFDRNSQDNGYLLNQIARRYEEGDAANVAAVLQLSTQISGLSNYSIQLAAQTYLDMANYVQVTLMPETQ